MTEIQKTKTFDLEERTFNFAKRTRLFIKTVPLTLTNREDLIQLTRSSGSIGANYIEANEALSKKDFIHRIKICRKEAKETIYWLKLIDAVSKKDVEMERTLLIKETQELMNIFGAIIRKSEN